MLSLTSAIRPSAFHVALRGNFSKLQAVVATGMEGPPARAPAASLWHPVITFAFLWLAAYGKRALLLLSHRQTSHEAFSHA